MSTFTSRNCSFTIPDAGNMKEKVLNWAQQFSTFCFLDNHRYPALHHSAECLLGAGVKRQLRCRAGTALKELDVFYRQRQADKGKPGGWLFGHLGYDLNHETAGLSSLLPDPVGFDDLFFFEPEVVIRMEGNELLIEAENPEKVYAALLEATPPPVRAANPLSIQARFSREEYLAVIEKLKQHILRGDCYEINFCMEFFSPAALIDPPDVFRKLCRLSPNPFSALYRVQDQWLLCASPERFLKKEGNRILSQPIKGTARRKKGNEAEDLQTREQLYRSTKDRSENVMVVDLVRNDLSRICREGTVQVDELYGIYTFPQVHQMISTVSGELKEGLFPGDIIRATFPMGSMTGAPKKKVMELIGRYEQTRRGIFSGALGYFGPDGDFDFNVVIRSIMYNARSGYLSFQAGSGITFYSDAEREWEECLLKAEAMRSVLEEE